MVHVGNNWFPNSVVVTIVKLEFAGSMLRLLELSLDSVAMTWWFGEVVAKYIAAGEFEVTGIGCR